MVVMPGGDPTADWGHAPDLTTTSPGDPDDPEGAEVAEPDGAPADKGCGSGGASLVALLALAVHLGRARRVISLAARGLR